MARNGKSGRNSRSRNLARGGKALAGGALALGAGVAANSAEAATFTVTNLNDAGAGSLRQAIADANGAAGADIVDFQAALSGTITLTTGQLDITDSVDIQGPGPGAITVDGNAASRVFYLYNNSATLDVTISGLTITNGAATIGAGVVDFDENLTLDDVVITGNAASVDGGGLWADGFNMNLQILNSTITGNTAGSDGGGIYVEDTGGPMLIQNSVISGNDAADDGGGIYFYDPDNAVTIETSTISGNSAAGLGGGVYVYDTDGGPLTFRTSTISGNDAVLGGGLALYGPDDPVVIENSTISGNQATVGDGGGVAIYALYGATTIDSSTIAGNSAPAGVGGGIALYQDTLNINNTIVGDNTAAADNDLGEDGTFDLTNSLVESPGGATIVDSGGNLLSQDPQLGPLANNGGPTETHLPAATSPAVNTGATALAVDQRGIARPQGVADDMGAVELVPLVPGTISLTTAAVSVAESAVTVTITGTRTGGDDGAVSVSINSANGSAVAPGDYGAVVAGTLSWADQDAVDKSINITIVNDPDNEPDETFTVTISAPTGGASLGAITTETVTILSDPADVSVIAVPTLGEVGKFALAGLVGLAALVVLRRRKGAIAAGMVLTLALASEAQAGQATTKAVTINEVTRGASSTTLRLSDGSVVTVPNASFELKDRRDGSATAPNDTKASRLAGRRADARPQDLGGLPVVLKVRSGPNGQVKRVKVVVYDSLAEAQREKASKGSADKH